MKQRRSLVIGGLAAATVGVAAGLWAASRPSAAIPMISPTYEIHATSGSHEASLLNLPVGMLGVPQVPTPVDVDGDLLPDVTVGVNLIDAEGLLQNPPDLADVIAPNIEINRLPTAVVLGQPSPPLHIEVRLRVFDLGGSDPDTVLRFGYDTGPGGSIPTFFKAVVGGLDQFFNPLEAIVDTGGTLGGAPTYQGPLELVGGVETLGFSADLGFHYRPLPDHVRLTYGDDDAGQHITYAHTAAREIDLDTRLLVESGDDVLDFTGRVDRLPGSIALDLTATGVEYRSAADGREPDVDVHVTSTSPDSEPLVADLAIESLPDRLAGTWHVPEDGPVEATFEASGQGIGAVDLDIRNYLGDSESLDRFVPTERQFLSVRQEGADRWITGRIERIRGLELRSGDGDIHVDASLGDGESPLQVDYQCAPMCSAEGEEEPVLRMDVAATVAPLPQDFTFDLDGPANPDDESPLAVTYDASQLTDVDATIELVRAPAPATAACGERFTLCADLAARNVPTHLSAVIDRTTVAEESDSMAVDLDRAAGGPKPDVFATVAIGGDAERTEPIVVDAQALGLPEHARIRLHSTWDADNEDWALDQAQFFACAAHLAPAGDPSCPAGPENRVGALDLSLRTFVDRPAGFPITVAQEPLHATVVARGTTSEVTARFTDIAEVEYLSTDALMGIQATAGDGSEPFAARFDLQDVPQGDAFEFSDTIVLDGATLDLTGEAIVTPMPSTFAMCFRTANTALTTTLPFTEPCVTSPLEDQSVDPMAIAYRLAPSGTGVGPEVDASFDTTIAGTRTRGLLTFPYSETTGGTASVGELPTALTAHVRLPEAGTEGPVDAIYEADAEVDLEFSAHKLLGDAACLDPRVTAEALCVEGTIDNIPTSATLHFDPTEPVDNLAVTTANNDSGEPVDLTDLQVSSVAPNLDTDEDDASVVLVTGEILDLPRAVVGTIDLPDERPDLDGDGEPDPAPVNVTVESADPDVGIGTIDVEARNFVTPDPTPSAPAGQRAGLPDPNQTILLFQRGDAFRADIFVEQLAGLGFRTARDADGNRLEGQSMLLAFGDTPAPPVVRVYADLNPGTGTTLADVTLQDLPTRTELCFRGKGEGEAVDPTFCDEADSSDGAFQLATVPRTGSELDADAFLRIESGPVDVLSASVGIDNVPDIVQGTFPAQGDGSLDVGGYRRDGDELVAEAIDSIDVELATFDLDDDGYGSDRPFDATPAPFATPGAAELGEQHVAVAVIGTEMQVRGHIDEVERVQLRNGLCAAPVDPGRDPAARADYPYFPDPDGFPVAEAETTYTCVRADFAGGTVDPFGVYADIEKDGQRITLDDAGLTNVPDWLQLTLADSPPVDIANDQFRARCGTETPAAGEHCVPPMVRFDSEDTSGTTPQLFGRLRIGTTDSLESLDDVEPAADIADFDVDGVPDAEGARAKVELSEDEAGETAVAAQVGFRVDVPGSLTVDPVQTWEDEVFGDPDDFDATETYTDLRFHYIVRDQSGEPVADLGKLQALAALADGTQILLHDPTLDEEALVPGELGVDLYLRNDKWEGRQFIQMEGRVSTPLSLGATLIGAPGAALPRLDAEILHLPAVDAGVADDEPSYRLQVELFTPGEKDEEPSDDECTIILCVEADVGLADVNVMVDFQPGDEPPARLTKVVVRNDGAANGVQIAGYPDVDDINDGSLGSAPVSALANVYVDPLSFEFDSDLPLLYSASFDLDSELNAAISMNKAADFQMRQNLMHVLASHTGTGALDSYSTIGPLNMNVFNLSGSVWTGFVKLFGLDFFPTYDQDPTPAQLDYLDCNDLEDILPHVGGELVDRFGPPAVAFLNDLDAGGTNALQLGGAFADDADALIWPLNDDRFDSGGILGDIFDFLAPIAEPFLCEVGPTVGEMPLVTDNSPADPLPRVDGNGLPDHAVPGYANANKPPPEPVSDEPLPSELPDENITAATELCGIHAYDHLEISAPITVATRPDDGGTPENLADDPCPATYVGELHISATDIVIHDGGSIDAAAILDEQEDFDWERFLAPFSSSTYTDWLGRCGGGGSHTNSGGAGLGDPGVNAACTLYFGNASLSASDGYTFNADEPRDPIDGPGFPGSGPSSLQNDDGGPGGGVIILNAETVTLEGNASLDASGGDGGDLVDLCVSDSFSGTGGGAGGSVVVNSLELSMDATSRIAADGGNGGDAYWGGGAGSNGVVKVLAPVRTGVTDSNVTADHGSPGGGCVPDGATGFDAIGDGYGLFVLPESVDSRALTPSFTGGFWKKTTPAIGYIAGAQPDGVDGFQVTLCGVWLGPGVSDLEFDMSSYNGPELISGPGVTYCGSVGDGFDETNFATFNIHTDHADGLVRRSDLASLTPAVAFGIGDAPTELKDGYWGIYSVAAQSLLAGNDCFDWTDIQIPEETVNDGLAVDEQFCTYEVPPTEPDVIIGIDHVAPDPVSVTLSSDSVEIIDENGDALRATGKRAVTFDIEAEDSMQNSLDPSDPNNRVPVSGVSSSICVGDIDGGIIFCDPAGATTKLTKGDGVKEITLVVVDRAGNVTEASTRVLLDRTEPAASLTPTALPDLLNGWYTEAPGFTLHDWDDGDPAISAGPDPEHRYVWRVDNGSEIECGADATCTIPSADLPDEGTLTIHYAGVDAVGNRLEDDESDDTPPMHSYDIKVDRTPPVVALRTVPEAHDGADGWFVTRPWVGLSGFDLPVDGSGLVPSPNDTEGNPGIFYTLYTDGVVVVADAPFDAPFQLDPGVHRVCWRAVDVAGNATSGPAACSEEIKVDDQTPSASISTSPAAPGASGWFVTEPSASASGVDTAGGSGVGAAGVVLSVDGGPFEPFVAPVTLGEGTHRLLARATDRAGNVGAIVERLVDVDRSHPVTTARLTPPDPARAPWFRALPTVTLRAADGDQNAGVAGIEYRLDGGAWQAYTAPFVLPAGVHGIGYRATDVSGAANIEPVRHLDVSTDVAPPTVTATSANKSIWSRLLGPATITLGWKVGDDQTGPVTVTVVVYNLLGQPVQTLYSGTVSVVAGQTVTGGTVWNGRDSSLLGLVPFGVYHYRVIATDAAGNAAMSGESKPITIRLL